MLTVLRNDGIDSENEVEMFRDSLRSINNEREVAASTGDELGLRARLLRVELGKLSLRI